MIRYHCDICDAQRIEKELRTLTMYVQSEPEIRHMQVCGACCDRVLSAARQCIESLMPRVRVPLPKSSEPGEDLF